jgi:hypothetical protein
MTDIADQPVDNPGRCPDPVTNRSTDDAGRHYPKRRDGATNHWAAVVGHVAEFDNRMKNKAQVEAKQNQHSLALTLNEQMNARKQATENLKKKEKDLERSCLTHGMAACRDEKALAKEKQQKFKTLLISDHERQIEVNKMNKEEEKDFEKGEHDRLMRKIANFQDPLEIRRQNRLKIERENKSVAQTRNIYKQEVHQANEAVNAKIFQMSKVSAFPEPQEVRRDIRTGIERGNREYASHRNSTIKSQQQHEQEKTKQILLGTHPFSKTKKINRSMMTNRKSGARSDAPSRKRIQSSSKTSPDATG